MTKASSGIGFAPAPFKRSSLVAAEGATANDGKRAYLQPSTRTRVGKQETEYHGEENRENINCVQANYQVLIEYSKSG